MNILVIQSTEIDPIGILGTHLEAHGAKLHTWLTEKQPLPPPAPAKGHFDGLIILGGPMNAHDDEKFPHLKQTVELIQSFHREHRPVMGVCLGAQLIARAFGSQVRPHTVPELGFSQVGPADSAFEDAMNSGFVDSGSVDSRFVDSEFVEPWLKTCPPQLNVMQWHFDTFELPQEATLLMTNDVCRNQAFRIGDNIYGFQFHFEVTPEIVISWLEIKDAWIEANYPQLDQQLREQLTLHAAQSGQFAAQVAKAWLNLVRVPAF